MGPGDAATKDMEGSGTDNLEDWESDEDNYDQNYIPESELDSDSSSTDGENESMIKKGDKNYLKGHSCRAWIL